MLIGIVYYDISSKTEVSEAKVFIAKENLENGTVITKEDIGTVQVNSNNKLSEYITDINEIVGKKLNKDIDKHGVILNNNLVDANDEEIKKTLLTISASNNVSILKPGDKVNVYSVENKDKFNNTSNNNVVFKELLTNKVIVDIPQQNNTTKKDLIVKATDDEVKQYLSTQQNSQIFVMKTE